MCRPHRRLLLLGLVGSLGAGAAGLGTVLSLRSRSLAEALHRPFVAHRGEVLFRVGRGSNAESIANRLEASGIIADRRVFLRGLEARDLDGRLQAGLYRFDRPLSPRQVMERIAGGEVATRAVTVPEGFDLRETAAALAEQEAGDADELRARFSDPAVARRLIGDLDPAAETLEGYLFPSTYRLPPEATPEAVAAVLVGQFRALWNDERRRRAAERGRSLREIATLASIIEKETGEPSERPRIASVFWNRLRLGMPLQSDPTVLFAMRRAGDFGNNIRKRDLDIASPYNTYRVRGLPPGPIASFGVAALDAVLEPDETDFLYFVSRNDGTHEFTRSLREHNRAVRKWQIDYFRRRPRPGS